MKALLKIWGIIVLTLFLNSCAAIRSGKGLSKNELNVGYTAPLGGSIRYGITDNIESRFSLAFESYNFDLYFHTNSESRSYNYGVTIGSSYLYDRKPYYFSGFTIDRKLGTNFYPYLSYIFYTDFINVNNQFSFGTEFKLNLSNRKKIYLLIIPEVSYLTKPIEVFGLNTHVIGTINIGLSFDLLQLTNR